VPARPLARDAHCQLLGSTTGLRGEVRTAGAPRARGELILIDAHQPYAVRYDDDRSPAIDFLYIDPDWLTDLGAQITDGAVVAPGLVTDLKLRDPALQDAATRYVASLDAQGSRLWRDALRHRLGVQLLLRHARALPRRRVRCDPLAPSSLRRIDDYVAAHLGQDLALAELAAITGLSRHQFVRRFHRSTGYTPHQYVIARRIERAATLLRETRLSIVDVASATGFASQSHLSTLFRRHRGLSPDQYRALRRR
jgi:AraC family transcriptional regulator